MPDITTIKIGEVNFADAIRSLREMLPMSDDAFSALNEIAKQRAFSFADAYSDSVAEAAQRILQGIITGDISVDQFLDKANAALDPFGVSLTAFQAQTIFETNIGRIYNDAKWRQLAAPEIRGAYPYLGHDTAADSRVRPNHYALDWRRIKTVFPIDDMIWTVMRSPLGFRCRCTVRPFSEAQVQALGLAVGRGEDWYGRSAEVTVPGGITRVVQILPDPGFGAGSLTGSAAAMIAVIALGFSSREIERLAA